MKTLSFDVITVVATIKQRLENNLLTSKATFGKNWATFYVKHPVTLNSDIITYCIDGQLHV